MSIKAVLFDLDGTLLPMDQEKFVKAYLGLLGKHLEPKGYEFDKFIKVMWMGVSAMMNNDGSCTNEEVFWKIFTEVYGKEVLKDRPFIDEFYCNEFHQVQKVCDRVGLFSNGQLLALIDMAELKDKKQELSDIYNHYFEEGGERHE